MLRNRHFWLISRIRHEEIKIEMKYGVWILSHVNCLEGKRILFAYGSTDKHIRKSSCVNAKGIPPIAYQILHLLSYPGDTPSLGVPHPLMWVPHPWTGVPHPSWGLPLPSQGVLPGQDWGTPWEGTWDQFLGYPLGKGPGTSHWVPPPRCGWTHTCENITFPILRMRAVIINYELMQEPFITIK